MCCGRGLRAPADVTAYLRARIRSLKKITAGNNVVPKIETSTGRETGSRWHLRLLQRPPQRPPDKRQEGWREIVTQPNEPQRHRLDVSAEGETMDSKSKGQECLLFPPSGPPSFLFPLCSVSPPFFSLSSSLNLLPAPRLLSLSPASLALLLPQALALRPAPCGSRFPPSPPHTKPFFSLGSSPCSWVPS